MKAIISLIVLGFSLVALTGCYTQIVTSESNDEIYEEPETIIVIIPTPLPPVDPCLCAEPEFPPIPPPYPSPPISNPDPPKEKIRTPENPTTRPSYDGNIRDPLRNSGSRNITDKRKR